MQQLSIGPSSVDQGSLFLVHRAAVYRVCLSMLRDPDDAADATQETFARALGQAQDVGQGWLIRVAKNICFDQLRKRGRIAVVDRPDERLGVAADDSVVSEAAVDHLLGQLTPGERRVVEKVVLEDRSCAEVAASLHISAGTGRVLLSRARRKLVHYIRLHPELIGGYLLLSTQLRRVRDAVQDKVQPLLAEGAGSPALVGALALTVVWGAAAIQSTNAVGVASPTVVTAAVAPGAHPTDPAAQATTLGARPPSAAAQPPASAAPSLVAAPAEPNPRPGVRVPALPSAPRAAIPASPCSAVPRVGPMCVPGTATVPQLLP